MLPSPNFTQSGIPLLEICEKEIQSCHNVNKLFNFFLMKIPFDVTMVNQATFWVNFKCSISFSHIYELLYNPSSHFFTIYNTFEQNNLCPIWEQPKTPYSIWNSNQHLLP